jgi:2-iminobutanoate/2-iminopropanoate deaminase
MPITIVESDQAPGHSGPVPQSVRAGDVVYVSALFGSDPVTDEIPDDAQDEARLMLTHLGSILAAHGAGYDRVVQAGIFMKELQRDRPAFNRVWAEVFGDHRPARSAVGVNDFGRPGKDFRYMMQAVAYLGE